MRYLLVLVIAMCVGASAADQPGWGPVEPLLGDWTGEGGGGPGQGTGWFSFKPDLQGRVVVRKNHSEYPASKERAAAVHDDLMVVYREAQDTAFHAIYFDSEGHTIRYEVQPGANGREVAFVSAAEPAAPRYRLTYTRVESDRLKIKFEIAPPGHADQFATYIEANARRASQ